MVIPQTKARDAIEARLRLVFESDAFERIYGDVQRPKVTLGFPVNEPPFYVAVDEIVTDVQPGQGASMGQVSTDFNVNVWCFARHADLKRASDTAMAYSDAVFASVIADRMLGGAVDLATPSVVNGGTAADGDKKHIATVALSIRCNVWATCPHELQEVINEGNM